MSAKSAPQLVPRASARRTPRHLPATVVVLALTIFVTGAGWLLEPQPVHEARVVPSEINPESQLQEPPAQANPENTAVAAAQTQPPPEPVTRQVVREDSRLLALADFLSRRYKVSQTVTLDLVGIAHAAGRQMGLDPLLIIAVMAVESRFNPIAESVAGAKGLMQVIPKYHGDKLQEFGGEKAVFDPETNILVGAQILKEYLARTGSMTTALQMYAGALKDVNDVYTGRVLTEKQRLQQVLRRSTPERARDVEASLERQHVAMADIR
jgi:hypothetical protein